MLSEARLRITVDCPAGTYNSIWEVALEIGRRFAMEYVERKHSDIVVYVNGRTRHIVWWTKARAVVVRVEITEVSDSK